MLFLHPVFVFLVFIFCAALWFALRYLFQPIGKEVKNLIENIKECMDLVEDNPDKIEEEKEQ